MAWTNTPQAIAKKKLTMAKNGTKQGKPLKFGTITPQQLQQAVDAYLLDGDKHHTVTGLAIALDTTRMTLLSYKDLDIAPELKHIITKAKETIQHEYEYNALNGNANTAMSIFTLKNNYGWVDKTETVNTNLNVQLDVTANKALANDFTEYLKGKHGK